MSAVTTGYQLSALPRSSSAKSSTSHWQLIGPSPNLLSPSQRDVYILCCSIVGTVNPCDPWPLLWLLTETSPHKHRLESETAQEKYNKEYFRKKVRETAVEAGLDQTAIPAACLAALIYLFSPFSHASSF